MMYMSAVFSSIASVGLTFPDSFNALRHTELPTFPVEVQDGSDMLSVSSDLASLQ